MILRTEISAHWQNENDSFRIDPPTVLGIKEACFAARRGAQKGFREGFEAGERSMKERLKARMIGESSGLSIGAALKMVRVFSEVV